jgi:pSer/pThr/pTyr-binding forkhead associated (FHA) protein
MSGEAEDQIVEFLEIAHFARDARSLDQAGFRARHGDHFLVRRGALSPERRPKRPQHTIALKDAGEIAALSARRGPSPSPDLVVFPVRTTGRSPFPRIITVGRTKNNDVILSDIGVSKFHAFFKDEDGKLVLQDAESRNGTFADGLPVPTKKLGKPSDVAPGTKVKFGMLEFWLLDAADLQELARRTFP